jgi:hypothetical protein
VRVNGAHNDTLDLYLKAALLMACDYSTQPLGRQRATNALMRTCIQDFGCAPADLPWGQTSFSHINACACILYKLCTEEIKETGLFTIWICGCIPGTRDEPVFAALAPNLVEQAICLTNPIHALDGDVMLKAILVDHAVRPEDRLVRPSAQPADHFAVLRSLPVQYHRIVRRITEIACVSALKGASTAVSNPRARGRHRDPRQE